MAVNIHCHIGGDWLEENEIDSNGVAVVTTLVYVDGELIRQRCKTSNNHLASVHKIRDEMVKEARTFARDTYRYQPEEVEAAEKN